MKSLTVAFFALPWLSFSTAQLPPANVWIKPGPRDARSPCPALNTLANHGYLPRHGRDITIPMIVEASMAGFNMAADAVTVAAKFGLFSGDSPTSMDLDALGLHNLIEHDASLSRQDSALGDNTVFNERIFATLAESNPGVHFYNTTSAGLVMNERLRMSVAANPNITNTPKELGLRTRESTFYLSVMGDPLTGVAPKKFVQIFFREERLPVAEGWKKSNVTITAGTLNQLAAQVLKVSTWTPTQQCEDIVVGPGQVL
ncbi:unnamed protein product [Mycena citricolor]|uniref:Heme haloperoxidase family profile domain-containing protein n=1 Tax=Mycena citricolor TaxID=2018698 RepID=A0AAD2JWR2_9AGAR|nr:unnamed protein product [Mycena citricolor]